MCFFPKEYNIEAFWTNQTADILYISDNSAHRFTLRFAKVRAETYYVLFITNYLFLYSIVSLVDLKCVLQKCKGTLYPRRQTCQAREGIFVNLHIDFSLFVVNPAFMRVLSTNFEVNSYI